MILVSRIHGCGHSSSYYYYYYYFFSGHAIIIPNLQKPHHIQPPNSTHTWTLIRHIAARVLVLIRITVLDLEPDPCFQIFLNISETNYRIINCNISNRRSSQELPFIFFELRAATCLWGRYDPKNRKFYTFFTYISSTSIPFQHHFRTVYRAIQVLHFMFWLLRCTLWVERIMSLNLKFPSLFKHYRKCP